LAKKETIFKRNQIAGIRIPKRLRAFLFSCLMQLFFFWNNAAKKQASFWGF